MYGSISMLILKRGEKGLSQFSGRKQRDEQNKYPI